MFSQHVEIFECQWQNVVLDNHSQQSESCFAGLGHRLVLVVCCCLNFAFQISALQSLQKQFGDLLPTILFDNRLVLHLLTDHVFLRCHILVENRGPYFNG